MFVCVCVCVRVRVCMRVGACFTIRYGAEARRLVALLHLRLFYSAHLTRIAFGTHGILVLQSQVRILLSTDIFYLAEKCSESHGGCCSAIKIPALKFS